MTLVDADAAQCRRNAGALEAHNDADVAQHDARTWMPAVPFDVVLADPPYAGGLAQQIVARREVLGHPGSWWVVETGTDTTLDCAGFEDVVSRDYGKSRLWVMRQV